MVGNKIKMRLGAPYDQQEVIAEVNHVFEPFTLSSSMVVHLLDSTAVVPKNPVVLKLFDRRFATQLREVDKISPWTSDIEQQYYNFILDSRASKFITRLKSNSDLAEEEGKTWDAAENEAYARSLQSRS